MPVFALYNFNDNTTVVDDAPINGSQNGIYLNGASAIGGDLILDGCNDFAKIYSAPQFQMDRGTLEINFTPADPDMTEPQTVLSRDSLGENQGSYRVEVCPDGSVRITHETEGGSNVFSTGPGFFSPGDVINLSYSWDQGGAGGQLVLENQTTGADYRADVPPELTMDMADQSQPWIVGASQDTSDPDILNNIDEHFRGTVDFFSLSDTVDNWQDPDANPDCATTPEDTPVVIDVLANDTDPNGDPLEVVGVPTAGHGTVAVNPDGTLTYTPDENYNGPDTITYTITDPDGNEATSTVDVTVTPVNDAPDAVDDTRTTPINTPIIIPVLVNDGDVDGDTLAVSAVGTSADGTVTLNGDGTVTFTPNDGFTGEATFAYDITDGAGGTDTATVTVSVTGPGPDGIVRGTAAGDLIDAAYVDPFDTDRVDANDALVSGDGPNDDRILAGDGNDTIFAGIGNDTVLSGRGDDLVHGGAGDDDLRGNEGNDTVVGSQGADSAYGGDDRDVFTIGSQEDGIGDFIDGSEGGDDFDTLDLRGSGPFSIVYDTANPENGTVTFLDVAGNPTGTLGFVNVESVTPCFTPGTLIATPRGEMPVEQLRAGDKVVTRDNGIQEIRWVGERSMTGQELRLNTHLQPVFIKRGALGNGLPEQDMLVSPNHRMLVANDRTQLYFDEHEVLVAAKHLIGSHGVYSVEAIGVNYIHFMFDRHEVVLSNGAWTESFQPGDYTLKGMGNAQRSEILELFPDLKSESGLEGYTAARRTLKRHEARILIK